MLLFSKQRSFLYKISVATIIKTLVANRQSFVNYCENLRKWWDRATIRF